MCLRLLDGRLKINILLFPCAAAMMYLMGAAAFCAFFIALVLHESAHAAAARAVGMRIADMELLPFGCAANLASGFESGGKEITVAAAGPVINIAAAFFMRLVFPSDGFSEAFTAANTAVAAVNLLPALPMDGGRILTAILSAAIKRAYAMRIAGGFGIAAGASVCGLFFYFAAGGDINISILISGGFMLYSSIKSIRSASFENIRRSEQKRRDLNKKTCLDVKHVAVRDCRTAAEVMLCLDPGKYNIIHMIDKDMRDVGSIDEAALNERIINGSANETLKKTVEN